MKKYALVFTVVLIAFFSIWSYNSYMPADLVVSRAENIGNFTENRANLRGNRINLAANGAESYEIAVDGLKKIAFENPKVKRVEAYIRGDSAVIAIRCDAVFFRSENTAICGDIIKKVEETGFREVYVTKDTDIFLKIAEMEKNFKKNGNETEYIKAKESILKKVKERIY